MKPLAQIAYEAYLASVRANKNTAIPPLPEWAGLADFLKAAWADAVNAVEIDKRAG